ncbi:radical SAM protein [Pseudoalteromonas maricaloris]|uniref:radical SAM protein n=1 Tax=Pseudoalteromonas maricaloris TaxID=184924 RepID=UPI003C1B7BF2
MNSSRINEIDYNNIAHIKACLLSDGVRVTEAFLNNYGAPFLEKRRAYGFSDPLSYKDTFLPQEIYLDNEGTICAVNIRESSTWELDFDSGEFFLKSPVSKQIPITFPRKPNFYDVSISSSKKGMNIATLYGGSSLGIFVSGRCRLVDIGKICKYCSIKVNHDQGVDFSNLIQAEEIYEVVKVALEKDTSTIGQVMINGGNFPDPDKGFRIYTECCRAARKAIDESGVDVELHLIAYPPENLSLIDELKHLGVCIAMNTEVHDKKVFSNICPGKDKDHILSSLKHAAKVLGRGRVFSILVGGLEELNSLDEGIDMLIKNDIVPVINVFHPDPGTELGKQKAPAASDIVSMGKILQSYYSKFGVNTPFYSKCGRNSIDFEASKSMF